MTQGDSCTIGPKLTFLLCFLRNLSNVSHFVALVRPSVPCPPLSSSPACHAKFRSSSEEEEEGDGANRTVKGPSGGKGMLRVVFLRKILAMYIFPILCKMKMILFFQQEKNYFLKNFICEPWCAREPMSTGQAAYTSMREKGRGKRGNFF